MEHNELKQTVEAKTNINISDLKEMNYENLATLVFGM